MLDITLLRKDLASAVARLETRKKPQGFLDVAAFTALEAERKTIQSRTQELQPAVQADRPAQKQG
jgi:seryl-tRNA synthetase